MSNRRALNWSAALRDLLSDRIVMVPGMRPARSLIGELAKLRRTAFVTPTGAYDRSAIMIAAVEAAKAHQRRTGDTWGAAMAIGLTAAWAIAKAARVAAKH